MCDIFLRAIYFREAAGRFLRTTIFLGEKTVEINNISKVPEARGAIYFPPFFGCDIF
jgi:hypothetical protein